MRVGGGGPPLPLVGARWGRRSVVFVMAVFREKGPVLRILPWHQHPQYSSMIPSVTLGAWQWSSCSSPVDFIFTTASGAVGPLPGEELGRLVGREHQHLGLRWPPVILIPTCATCDPLKSNRPDCSRCGQQQRLPRGSDAVIMSVDDGGRSPFCGRFAVGVRQSCGAALCCLFWGYCVRLEPLRSNWCAWRCVLCFYGCLVFFESLPHVPSVPCLCCSPRPDRRAQPCSKAAVADDPSVPIVGARLRRDVWVCHAVPIPLSVPPIQCFSLPCRRAFFVACSRVDCCPPPLVGFVSVTTKWPLAAVIVKWPDTDETRAGDGHTSLLSSHHDTSLSSPAPSISCQGARACVLLVWGRARLRLPGRSGARPTSRKMFNSSLVAAEGLALLGRGVGLRAARTLLLGLPVARVAEGGSPWRPCVQFRVPFSFVGCWRLVWYTDRRTPSTLGVALASLLPCHGPPQNN